MKQPTRHPLAEPAVPITSIDQLLGIWAARDDTYARRPLPLDDATTEAVRSARQFEVRFLPPEQRARAWAVAKAWFPPMHGQ